MAHKHTLNEVSDERYEGDGFVMSREYNTETPNGNPIGGRWALRGADGILIDVDQYRTDIADRHDLALVDKVRDTSKYKIVRHYMKGGKRTIIDGLSLHEAQAHCKDPQNSSTTCTKPSRKAITRRNGAWFDGYTRA